MGSIALAMLPVGGSGKIYPRYESLLATMNENLSALAGRASGGRGGEG